MEKLERGERALATLARVGKGFDSIYPLVRAWASLANSAETCVETEVFEAHGTYQAVRYILSDHDQALWLHVDGLHSLEWAAADIPVLDERIEERRLRA